MRLIVHRFGPKEQNLSKTIFYFYHIYHIINISALVQTELILKKYMSYQFHEILRMKMGSP